MKTLDEVIKGFECCDNTDCGNCPYKILFNDDSHVPCDQFSKDEDALHYLKEYQEMLNNVENDPLSWEELHLLENKPVWVEHKLYKKWAIITGFGVDDNIVRFEGKQLYAPEFKDDMGERWNAYRKERK